MALCPQGLSAPLVRGRFSRLSREPCAFPSVVTSIGSLRLMPLCVPFPLTLLGFDASFLCVLLSVLISSSS